MLSVYGTVPPHEGFPRARAAASRALELDPRLAEAHASLGFTKFAYAWDYDGAERDLRRSIELDPDYATAHQWLAAVAAARGRAAEAIRLILRAEELDPLSDPIAKDAYERLFGIRPEVWGYRLVAALARAGDSARAVDLLRQLEQTPGNSSFAKYERALAYASLGDHERALALLEAAAADRFIPVTWINVSPWFEPLRGAPRFQALLARVRLN